MPDSEISLVNPDRTIIANNKNNNNQLPRNQPQKWYYGGLASCCAALFSHPLDTLKVRLQTEIGKNVSVFSSSLNIIKYEGVFVLYKGLSASLLRQMTYSTTRFAVYEAIKENKMKQNNVNKLPTSSMILYSMIGGGLGGIAGNPADIVNIRMQADGRRIPSERRNYRHAIDGLIKISKTSGVSSLFNGLGPNVTRAMLMTCGQLVSYDVFKLKLMETPYFIDNVYTHFTASLMAGFIATFVCSPADVTKTRVMNAQHGEYRNAFDCIRQIFIKEGGKAFFKGFWPSFYRLAPHTVVMFLSLEQIKKWGL